MTDLSSLYKLPRSIEAEHPGSGILVLLAARCRSFGDGGEHQYPVLELTDSLKAALLAARHSGSIIRGIEGAAGDLGRQRHGLELLKKHTPQGDRISRLVLMSADGSKNFYRKAAGLLAQHRPRVLGCVLDCDSQSLGNLLFSPGATAKLVLVSHKQDVARILLSLTALP